MIDKEIKQIIGEAVAKLGGSPDTVTLDVPTQREYGDFASGVALRLSKQLKNNPMKIGGAIIDLLPDHPGIQRVNLVPPGFINIWISTRELLRAATDATGNKYQIEPYHMGPNKKIMVEFAHPNTHKLFHIGHLRNISTGEAIVRLLEAVGNQVVRTNYQGDVGLHIAKCLYVIKKKGINLRKYKSLEEKITLLGKSYSEGQRYYDEDEKTKEEIHSINKMIYDQSEEIKDLWKQTVGWSLEYFERIYKRVYSRFDRCYFESEMAARGIEIAKDLLQKGLLEKSEGAVIFNGKKYGTDTRVFINSLGFPTYEGKELALAEKEFRDFGELDKNIHVVTPEQTSFFKVTFKIEELIDKKKYGGKQQHLAYNWVQLKKGKMSSRTGNIVEGGWLIDEVKKKLKKKFKIDEKTAETLSVASVKYSFLKVSTQMEIAFDFKESISLDGNSAPYLIYTYVRTRSVVRKSGGEQFAEANDTEHNEDEVRLLRKIYRFSHVVHESAKKLSPNLLTTYLFELAQDYNLFYQKNPILKAEGNKRITRLLISEAVGNIIKRGLNLLGIYTVEEM